MCSKPLLFVPSILLAALGCTQAREFDYTPHLTVLHEGQGEEFGPELFPLEEGSFWIYRADPDVFTKRQVSGEGRVFDHKVKRVLRSFKYGTVEELVYVDSTGVWDHGLSNVIYAAPVPRLVFPVRVGKRWRMTNDSANLTVEAQVEAIEPVGTVMGVYRAVRVLYFISGDLTAWEKVWYAPGLGVILREGWQRAKDENMAFEYEGAQAGEYEYSFTGRLWYAEVKGYENDRQAARIR